MAVCMVRPGRKFWSVSPSSFNRSRESGVSSPSGLRLCGASGRGWPVRLFGKRVGQTLCYPASSASLGVYTIPEIARCRATPAVEPDDPRTSDQNYRPQTVVRRVTAFPRPYRRNRQSDHPEFARPKCAHWPDWNS